MKNKLRRISAMILSLLMTISMVGGDVLTVVALDETYQETESVTETEPATAAETESQTESETPAPTEAVTEATTEAAPETEETVQTTEGTTESAVETQAETAPSTEQETEAPSYTVNFKIHENGTAKVYVNGQEVTYKVTDEGKVTFIVEANDQFEVNVADTISANPNLNIHRTSRTDVNEFEVSEVKSDITINIHTQKIPETESEEPPSEETQASETETTETSEETETEETESETIEETVVETESEEKSYELTIRHVLETSIGLYADERTVTLKEEDFVDGVYDLSKQAYQREGIYATSIGSISKEAFDSENKGYGEITYAVAEGWKAVPKNRSFSRSIFIGTFDDVEIVPAGQLPVTFNFVYEDGTIAKASETIMFQEKMAAATTFLMKLPMYRQDTR